MVLQYFEDNSMFISHLRVNYKLSKTDTPVKVICFYLELSKIVGFVVEFRKVIYR